MMNMCRRPNGDSPVFLSALINTAPRQPTTAGPHHSVLAASARRPGDAPRLLPDCFGRTGRAGASALLPLLGAGPASRPRHHQWCGRRRRPRLGQSHPLWCGSAGGARRGRRRPTDRWSPAETTGPLGGQARSEPYSPPHPPSSGVHCTF